MRTLIIVAIAFLFSLSLLVSSCNHQTSGEKSEGTKKKRGYNETYREANLDRIAFPIGGIGAGMICLEGTGFGNVGLKNGKPFLKMMYGNLEVKKVLVSGKEQQL